MLVYLHPMATNTFKHLSVKMTTNPNVLSMIQSPYQPTAINNDYTDTIRPELEPSCNGLDRSFSLMHQLFRGADPQDAASDNGPGHLWHPGVGLELMLSSAQHSFPL
jgi:hypothetical protein